MKKLKKLSVVHPFLFALFPILFLFAGNMGEAAATELLLPIVVIIAGTLILFFSLRLITKSYNKAGIITSYFLLLFFSYGHVTRLIDPSRIGGVIIATFSQGLLWASLFITGAFLVIKSRRNFLVLNKFLNIVAVILVIIPIINIGIYQIKTIDLASGEIQEMNNKEGNGLILNESKNLPDIYYIILDEYARADTLRELYNYDNSEFIDYLTDKGFYVASKSRSNYAWTALSLASSLNMEYINYLSDTATDLAPAIRMARNNKVSQFLKSKGYRYIFVSTGFFESGMSNYADVYRMQPGAFGIRMSNFTSCLIQTTALAPFNWWIGGEERGIILYAFNTLADMPNIEGPKFVWAHVNCPHPPFVFDRNGNTTVTDVFKMQFDRWQRNRWQNYQAGYVDQLIFVNGKIEELVDEILSKSDVQPIIILQADTGPAATGQFDVPEAELTKVQLDERMNILNAYYLPENGSRLLYASITPVNSFRIVFNLYFDTDYDLLEDKSYFLDMTLVPPESNSD